MIKRFHVCEILKEFTQELYSYEQSDWLDMIFAYLDHVLVCNQHITNTFTHILKTDSPTVFYEQYPEGLFPKFLHNYDQDIIKENVDRINDEIDNIKPGKIIYPSIDTLSKFELLDLRVPYKNIIQILRHIKDPIVERAEYGYYIGSLLKISVDKFLGKYDPDSDLWIEPNWNILKPRVDSFRPGVFCAMEEK